MIHKCNENIKPKNLETFLHAVTFINFWEIIEYLNWTRSSQYLIEWFKSSMDTQVIVKVRYYTILYSIDCQLLENVR